MLVTCLPLLHGQAVDLHTVLATHDTSVGRGLCPRWPDRMHVPIEDYRDLGSIMPSITFWKCHSLDLIFPPWWPLFFPTPTLFVNILHSWDFPLTFSFNSSLYLWNLKWLNSFFCKGLFIVSWGDLFVSECWLCLYMCTFIYMQMYNFWATLVLRHSSRIYFFCFCWCGFVSVFYVKDLLKYLVILLIMSQGDWVAHSFKHLTSA